MQRTKTLNDWSLWVKTFKNIESKVNTNPNKAHVQRKPRHIYLQLYS